MKRAPSVLLVATMDTKAEEASYVENCLEEAGLDVLILDPGIRGQGGSPVAITRDENGFPYRGGGRGSP